MRKLLVIAIPLGVLALLLLPAMHTGGHGRLPRNITQIRLRAYDNALAAYLNDYGRPPKGVGAQIARSLSGLTTNGNPRRVRYLESVAISKTWYGKIRGGNTDTSGNLLDGWYRPISVMITSDGWSLISSGEDGVMNTADDIVVDRDLK